MSAFSEVFAGFLILKLCLTNNTVKVTVPSLRFPVSPIYTGGGRLIQSGPIQYKTIQFQFLDIGKSNVTRHLAKYPFVLHLVDYKSILYNGKFLNKDVLCNRMYLSAN